MDSPPCKRKRVDPVVVPVHVYAERCGECVKASLELDPGMRPDGLLGVLQKAGLLGANVEHIGMGVDEPYRIPNYPKPEFYVMLRYATLGELLDKGRELSSGRFGLHVFADSGDDPMLCPVLSLGSEASSHERRSGSFESGFCHNCARRGRPGRQLYSGSGNACVDPRCSTTLACTLCDEPLNEDEEGEDVCFGCST